MILQNTVYALQLNTTKFDRDAETITVRGSVDAPNTMITIEVLKPSMDWEGISDEDLSTDDFAYIRQIKADALGNFSDSFGIRGVSGVYSVRVYSVSDKAYCYDNDLHVFSRQDIDGIINKINNEKDISDLETILINEDNAFMLGIEISEIAALDSSSKTKFLTNFIAERTQAELKSVADIKNVINMAYLIMQINNATTASELSGLMEDYADILSLNDENSYNIYTDTTFYDAGRITKLLAKLSEKNDYSTISDFRKNFREQTLLYACYNRENYHTIGDIFNASVVFKELDTGNYSSLSNKADVHKEINKLTSPAKTVQELAMLVRTAAEPKIPSKTGGSSSGKGSGSSVIKPTETLTNAELPIVTATGFSDMAGYEWAEKAVNELQATGIISGRGNNIFSPGDAVTREEFLKMLVNVLGIQPSAASVAFEDVDSDAWYAGFISAGVEMGIINGISETEFGVGLIISRQDMAVMVYNALAETIKTSNNAEDFADFDEIAVYAQEAVKALHSNGLVNGVGDGMFAPKQAVNRASAAQLIYGVNIWRNDNV